MSHQVRKYLGSKSWETRVAAAQAVEAIAKNVRKWQPSYQARDGDQSVESSSRDSPLPETGADYLNFDSFDINQVGCVKGEGSSSEYHTPLIFCGSKFS